MKTGSSSRSNNRKIWQRGSLVLSLALSAISPLEANTNVPAPVQDHPILLKGGTIYPVSSVILEGAQILFQNGKISALGNRIKAPKNTEIIDISGKSVYPGLIGSNTLAGLVEIGAVRATRDFTESGEINPNSRAESAVNPDSEIFPVTRANGVLVINTVPSAGKKGLIAGTSALMKLDGWTWEEMVIKAPVGLHIKWPERISGGPTVFNRNMAYGSGTKDKEEAYEKALRRLRDSFANARAYLKVLENSPLQQDSDLRWEAMIPVLKREIPVFVHADRLEEIRRAVHWSEEEVVRLVIVGGQDAWRAADLLKEKSVAVIVSPVMALPLRRWEPYDTPFANPAKLHASGILFAIANAGGRSDAAHERNLPYQAAMAAAYGLPKEEALKAVTLNAAKILGVEDRLGSLEAGKDATLIVTDGDPLEIRTQVEMAFIDGRLIDLSSRHTRLYQKYQEKYRQLKKE